MEKESSTLLFDAIQMVIKDGIPIDPLTRVRKKAIESGILCALHLLMCGMENEVVVGQPPVEARMFASVGYTKNENGSVSIDARIMGRDIHIGPLAEEDLMNKVVFLASSSEETCSGFGVGAFDEFRR